MCVVLLVLVSEGKNFLRNSSRLDDSRVLSARRNLSAGTQLSIHDLSVTHIRNPTQQNYFNEEELHEVIGSMLKEDLKADDPIKKEQVQTVQEKRFSVRVPKGFRAYSIHFTSRLPVEPKDKLDILGKKGPSQKTEVLVQDRRVLAVKPDEVGQEIVLAVTPEDAALLDNFKDQGHFSFLLRNPDDLDSQKVKRKTPPKGVKQVELWE
jgi:Flp pilus assembly protein CpaB